jgi:hypothetical protein
VVKAKQWEYGFGKDMRCLLLVTVGVIVRSWA